MRIFGKAPGQKLSYSNGRNRFGSQRGLSLVELMIAAAISIVIVAALAQLFSDMSRSNQELAKTNSQIENARFAIQILETDLVHAGYWGGYIPEFDDLTKDVDPTQPTVEPDPCKSYGTWNAADEASLIGISVQVYRDDLTAIPECNPGIVSPELPATTTSKKAATDILVVRHADTCVPGDANCEADVPGRLYLQVSNCETEIDAGDEYIFDDAADPNSFSLQGVDCPAGDFADKRRFIQNIYFIRNYSNTVGDDIPTLVRSEFDFAGGTLQQMAAVPLVEGIERFRVELGIDNVSETGDAVNYNSDIGWPDPLDRVIATFRGDGYPDEFRHCPTDGCNVDEHLLNAVVARIYILARAVEATPGYTDSKTYVMGDETIGPLGGNFKRHVFSTTVRLNNISGRRETPWDPNTP